MEIWGGGRASVVAPASVPVADPAGWRPLLHGHAPSAVCGGSGTRRRRQRKPYCVCRGVVGRQVEPDTLPVARCSVCCLAHVFSLVAPPPTPPRTGWDCFRVWSGVGDRLPLPRGAPRPCLPGTPQVPAAPHDRGDAGVAARLLLGHLGGDDHWVGGGLGPARGGYVRGSPGEQGAAVGGGVRCTGIGTGGCLESIVGGGGTTMAWWLVGRQYCGFSLAGPAARAVGWCRDGPFAMCGPIVRRPAAPRRLLVSACRILSVLWVVSVLALPHCAVFFLDADWPPPFHISLSLACCRCLWGLLAVVSRFRRALLFAPFGFPQ